MGISEDAWFCCFCFCFCSPEMKETLGSSREMSVLITPRSLASAWGRAWCRLSCCSRMGVTHGETYKEVGVRIVAGHGGTPLVSSASLAPGVRRDLRTGHHMDAGAIGAPMPRRSALPSLKKQTKPDSSLSQPIQSLPRSRRSWFGEPVSGVKGAWPGRVVLRRLGSARVRLSPPWGRPTPWPRCVFGLAPPRRVLRRRRLGRVTEREAGKHATGLNCWSRHEEAKGWTW